MKEKLIEFNTAKLAKKKGFDIFNNIYFQKFNNVEVYDEQGKLTKEPKQQGVFIHAPTQSLLAKWLREVHNIHVDVMSHNINDFWYNLQQFNNESRLIYKTNLSNFNTYEKAYEHGLFEALNLIK